jgi:hypothetical protein
MDSMRRCLLFVIMAMLIAAGVYGLAVAGDEEGTVLIQNEYSKRLKNPVTLSHKKHIEVYKIECTECHHAWKKEERDEPQKCAECHTEEGEGKKLGTKRAYHKLCMDCHKGLKKESKPCGPTTKCSGCHPSKAKK